MGKRIIARRRGKGTNVYRLPSVGLRFKPSYRNEKGKVVDIVHDVGRDSPVAKISYPDGSSDYVIAYKGLKVGDETANIGLPLGQIPESTQVFGLETYPNSGPKLCMAPGSAAIILSKTEKDCIVELPSRKTRVFNLMCRATIGTPAGDGRDERPWVKAGKRAHFMKVRGKRYPITSARAMNAVAHPFGSGYGGGIGMPKTVSRDAPPGRKVGSIAARRTGKRKL
ncbi:MAG TPA: 50S ribosomal protein L2 [archaeon]|nr:50S ribosomal protein L2 [archaeon]